MRSAAWMAVAGVLCLGVGCEVGDGDFDDALSPSPTLEASPAITPTTSPTVTPEPPTQAPDDDASAGSGDETPSPTPTGETPPAEPSPSEAPAPTPSSPPANDTPDPVSPTPVASPVEACPPGMSAVYGSDPSDIAFCIDTYEVVVSGNLGALDQYAPGAQPSTATASAQAGQVPSIVVTYDQAAATCRNTPVLSSTGLEVGRKRLVTSWEWQDAADGFLGNGGGLYPYGESFDETACATLTADGQKVYEELQPAGSLPRCVSRFGVFDQSGNAWEWADSGILADIAAFYEFTADLGLDVHVDEAGLVRSSQPLSATSFRVEIAGVQPPDVSLDEEGYFYVNAAQTNPQAISIKGYLKVNLRGVPYNSDGNFLPVALSKHGDGSTFRFVLLEDDDGAPVPDKRGGAYYTGSPQDCSSQSSQMIHFHDFQGTISFRCSADPLVIWE